VPLPSPELLAQRKAERMPGDAPWLSESRIVLGTKSRNFWSISRKRRASLVATNPHFMYPRLQRASVLARHAIRVSPVSKEAKDTSPVCVGSMRLDGKT
jgi:hypothetical protein